MRSKQHDWKRTGAVLLLLLTLTSLPGKGDALDQMARSVTIYRDLYGVPHVFGTTDASCAFGAIYAQAEDNFWQIEENYIRALGRASEIHGVRSLASDRLVRTLEIPRLAREEYQRSSPAKKALLDGIAAGLNYFIRQHPHAPRLLFHFEPWHVLTNNRYALYAQFIYGRTGLNAEDLPIPAAETQGSNAWAISKGRSATGNAMLLINPHQPFFGVGQLYELHLYSRQGWNLSGTTFFGSALLVMGHNEHLGWAHTVNTPDIADVWEETFDRTADPLAYRYGSGYRRATEWTDTIRVRAESGVKEQRFTFRKTHHGPIVGKKDGKFLALRMARFEEGGQFDEWYSMGRARSLDEFKKALSAGAIPMFNVIYADRQGNIYYVYNAAVPRRSTIFDWSRPVDGSNPETEWQGYHALNELPQVTNPKSGFLQNCNSTPFATTLGDNPEPANFPKYMVGESDNPRARISRRILWNTGKFNFEDWSKAAFNTYVIQAEPEIPWLAAAYENNPQPSLAEPIAELRNWDYISRTTSIPMSLYVLWRERQADGDVFRALNGGETAVQSLAAVVAELTEKFGTWRVPWGELNRLQRRHSGGEESFRDDVASLPIAGAPGDLGIVFSFYTRPEKGQKRRYGVAGHSFVSVIEFGPQVKARSLLVFGQSASPSSPHYSDQAQLYASERFKPAWFSLSEILSHTKRKYHPGEAKPR